jgi:hypothetical protein
MTNRPHIFILFIVSFIFATNTVLAEVKKQANTLSGTVKSSLNVPSYTYIEVTTDKTTVWVAVPTTKVEIGSSVKFSTNMPMRDFHSTSLKRTFPLIYFVSGLEGETNKPNIPQKLLPHVQIKSTGSPLKGIEKLKGGKNIAEIYTEKVALKGKMVKIRAKVTRFSAKIMGKNWLHIQDSSSKKDLTVTTQGVVKKGAIVIIEGKLALDKNFGNGYRYPVILEEATFLNAK